MCGNTSELGDVGGKPGKSCLFFLTAALSVCYPGIGLTGDRVTSWESTIMSDVSGAFPTALENPRETLILLADRIFSPGRTHNRIRSPR